jgi:hypothetical protein
MWTTETFAAACGILVSLIVTFVPKLNVWFASKPEDEKKQIMAMLLIGLALIGGVASCTGLIVVLQCSKDGILSFALQILIPALLGNQAAYAITPLPDVVKKAKLQGKIDRGEAEIVKLHPVDPS